MPLVPAYRFVSNLWNVSKTKGLDELEQLVYRSNLLGSDPRVVNTGGGNTSAKIWMEDLLDGSKVQVLWVKGSGGDLRTAKQDGFASLYQDKVLALEGRYRGLAKEDEMVALYPHCTFGLNPRAASIDTPLHAFIPFPHVDHSHPDAAIALAAAHNSRDLTKRVYGPSLGWLPWRRPGFELAMDIQKLMQEKPGLRGILLAGHGLINWGESSEGCYRNSLDLIEKAGAFLHEHRKGRKTFGGLALHFPRTRDQGPRTQPFAVLPYLRGAIRVGRNLIAHLDRSKEVFEFIHSKDAPRLAELGTSCPDHFLRTKVKPLFLPFKKANNLAAIKEQIDKALERFRRDYRAYYDKNKEQNSPPLRNPNPAVVLIPGLGMLSFGPSKAEAEVTGEFYRRAIEVMKGAESVGRYVALPQREAFRIEYWELEEAKLKRMPKPKALAGEVALVTGSARGIGLAVARKFLQEGAHVVLSDIDGAALQSAADALAKEFGADRVWARAFDVGDEGQLDKAMAGIVERFGGLDILVSNAGLARRGSVAETSSADYNLMEKVLMRGYFNAARAASRIMAEQKRGNIIFVVSKNAVATGGNASVYSAAKAFELHLMRTIAADMGAKGIRANAINPDAVISGSGIWSTEWKRQTAKTLGIRESELMDHYKKRTILGVNIYPEDIAEAALFLASPGASKITGCVITVDGGVKDGFLR